MVRDSNEQTQFDDVLPSQVQRAVSAQNQFQLPAAFGTELGFQSSRTDMFSGAKVAWYYHEKDDKAVLGSDAVDRPSLELVGVSRLGGVSDDALAAGDVDGARVTIISELPDSLHERLTQDAVVLKPVYARPSHEFDATYVSVYPAQEYGNGQLPNVDRECREVEDDDGSEQVKSIHNHANSI